MEIIEFDPQSIEEVISMMGLHPETMARLFVQVYPEGIEKSLEKRGFLITLPDNNETTNGKIKFVTPTLF